MDEETLNYDDFFIINSDEFFIPDGCELIANPTIKFNEIKQLRYSII